MKESDRRATDARHGLEKEACILGFLGLERDSAGGGGSADNCGLESDAAETL